MKVTRIAILIALCMLVALASAQSYSIRANRGLNLRAEPSRSASIAETIHSGTVLQVVGEFNRWLKIDRNGREVWLANWVNFSRVDDSAPPASPALPAPTGPIDNCCYVDRQCSGDQEWMAGWHAFQNGQCAAPPQPQPVTPAQPGSSAPANVDNCCLVDRQCETDADWLSGYWAFQHNQCPAIRRTAAARKSFRPPVEGSAGFVREVSAALDWLERQAPEWYNYVISGTNLIVEVPVSPDEFASRPNETCTALARSPGGIILLETCIPLKYLWLGGGAFNRRLNTAEILAHEACHLHTYAAGIRYEDEEYECHKPMMGVTVALVPYPRNRSVSLRGEPALNVVRRFCREGFYPELYCPAIQRLQG